MAVSCWLLNSAFLCVFARINQKIAYDFINYELQVLTQSSRLVAHSEIISQILCFSVFNNFLRHVAVFRFDIEEVYSLCVA